MTSLADLEDFVQWLRRRRKEHPDEWLNHDLDDYLEALAAVTESEPQRYRNLNAGEVPLSWSVFAELLERASDYE